MTLDDLLAELPRLGPWRLHRGRHIRAEGPGGELLCPLGAALHARGLLRHTANPTGRGSRPVVPCPDRCARLLGLGPRAAVLLADAADAVGADPDWPAFAADAAAVRAVRARLLLACGIGGAA